MKTVKAKINVYCSGKYGRKGEYIAIVEPEYFKNGKMKKSIFKVIEILEITKKWYAYGRAKITERIESIIE